LAANGDTDAQTRLAVVLIHQINMQTKKTDTFLAGGFGKLGPKMNMFHRDHRAESEALALFLLASKSGNVKAKMRLAECYDSGIGCRIDKRKAFDTYLELAKDELSLRNDVDELKMTTRIIVEAQYQVACRYQKGEGINHNSHRALKWFVIAARNGHPISGLKAHDLMSDPSYGMVDYKEAASLLGDSPLAQKKNTSLQRAAENAVPEEVLVERSFEEYRRMINEQKFRNVAALSFNR